MTFDFTDRVVLITGAGGGLGAAVTDAFLAAGAVVAGVSRSGGSKDSEKHYHSVAADLTTREGAQTAVEEALRKAKKLDILVHIMGGFAGGQPVAETDDATWDKMMNLNLRAAFLVARAALPPMLQAGYGRVVAVGSRAGVEPAATLSAYSVSKAGLNMLIRTIAEEVRDSGITANVVMPSTIDTPANRKAMPDADHSRWVKPKAIAQQILWLCSDEAAEVSGALIPVYGRA